MVLHFPNLDALRLALTSGMVPELTRASAARFGFDADRSLWIAPTATLDENVVTDLRRLDVGIGDASPIALPLAAVDWMQAFPLTRDPRSAEVGDRTPILFETNAGQIADLVAEMLRLGNDRQSFRWLAAATDPHEGSAASGLLRVLGPPYYSLLRAMDRTDERATGPTAYREAAPRVWVQVGFAHPLAEHVRPPAGQWLLMRFPHDWTFVPEGHWRDIYEVIDFQVHDKERRWNDASLPTRIEVPVRLTRGGGASETAELWVLREPGSAQLEELVRHSDNDLLARLAFAVGVDAGERRVVLRSRPSHQAPPVLVLDGLGFYSYLRIPNLYVPIGTALHPPLRRDAVIQLLAGDRDRVVWLSPTPSGSGGFTPESLPDAAFRPLGDWVENVLEHEHQAIQAWLGASQFDFEGFVCNDDPGKKKQAPNEPAAKRSKKKAQAASTAQSKPIDIAPQKKATERPAVDAEVAIPPSEYEASVRRLEQAYQGLTTALDDPARGAIWREMAPLYGALNQHGDAAICWSNALWELESVPADGAREWFQRESKHALGDVPPTGDVFLRMLQKDAPKHAQGRLIAGYLLFAAATPTAHARLRPLLGRIQDSLLQHETYVGVRLAWLAWCAVHRIAGGDVLTLARARDRLLERLHLQGLSPDLDLPGFLRYSGSQANDRFHAIRDRIVRLRPAVQDWAQRGANPTTQTHAYIDLIFAFGLARVGEATEAHACIHAADEVLANADDAHAWLHDAFAFRIQQALDGKPALGSFPRSLLDRLDAIEKPAYLKDVDPGIAVKQSLRDLRLKVERLREKSHILEPLERLDAYRRWFNLSDDALKRELTALQDLHDREELLHRFGELFSGKRKLKGVAKNDPRIVITALELAPRLGQSFAEETLDKVPAALARMKDAEGTAELLEKSIFLAAHCDRKDDLQRFVAQLHGTLQTPGAIAIDRLIAVVTGGLRGLRKLGLRDACLQLLQRASDIAAGDRSLRAGPQAKRLGLLLELAGAWWFFDDEPRATAILDEARNALRSQKLSALDQTSVACAYMTALGQAPMEIAIGRITEFFEAVHGVHDNYTTLSHYSLSRLMVVEAMILAIVSDDFTLDRSARQRLDDDEFLVRRRIHRDVRAALSTGAA